MRPAQRRVTARREPSDRYKSGGPRKSGVDVPVFLHVLLKQEWSCDAHEQERNAKGAQKNARSDSERRNQLKLLVRSQ